MRLNSKFNERGNIVVSLIFAVVSLALFTGVMRMIAIKERAVNEWTMKQAILNLRLSTLGILGDQVRWRQMAKNNSSMACLAAHTCKNGSTRPPPPSNGSPPPLRVASFVTSSYLMNFLPMTGETRQTPQGQSLVRPRDNNSPSGQEKLDPKQTAPPGFSPVPLKSNFSLYDAAGRLVYDTTNPKQGISLDGTFCREFSLQGNDRCPIRMDLEWLPSCENSSHPGSCINPEELVSISFTYSPKSPELKFAFKSSNYNFVGERLTLGSDVPLLRCGQIGYFYIGNFANGINNLRGLPSDAAGCVNASAFRGPMGSQGAPGRRGVAGAPGVAGPAGCIGPPAPGSGLAAAACTVMPAPTPAPTPPNLYCTSTPIVCGLYYTLVGRVPDQAGSLFWQQTLEAYQAQGLTASQAVSAVMNDMMKTPEYITVTGGTVSPATLAASVANANNFMAATGTTGAACVTGTGCGGAEPVYIDWNFINQPLW